MSARHTLLIFAPPIKMCTDDRESWRSATQMIFAKVRSFAPDMHCEFVELFTPRFLEFPQVVEAMQSGVWETPLVLLDGNMVQSGGKLSERMIRNAVKEGLGA